MHTILQKTSKRPRSATLLVVDMDFASITCAQPTPFSISVRDSYQAMRSDKLEEELRKFFDARRLNSRHRFSKNYPLTTGMSTTTTGTTRTIMPPPCWI
jgi:hypothetical protein